MSKNKTDKIKEHLPSFYKQDDSSNFHNFLKSFGEELDSFEDEKNKLRDAIFIDTTIGDELESLAKLFRLSRRSGETDAQLRTRIKGFWPGFSGGGTKEALKQTINRITGIPESDIIVTDVTDTKFRINITLNTFTDLELQETIEETINNAKAAGVGAIIEWTLNTPETISITDDFTTIGTSPLTGGQFILGVSKLGGSDTL